MNVGINLLFFYEITGIGIYVKNLLKNIGDINKKDTFFVFTTINNYKDFKFDFKNFVYIIIPFNFKNKFLKLILEQFFLPFYLIKYKIDILFSPSIFHPLFYKLPQIVVVHDVIFLKNNKKINFKNFYFYILLKSLKNKNIITVSNFSKNDILNFYKSNIPYIHVVYNGLPEIPFVNKKFDNNILIKFKIKKPYFFYIGRITYHKNIENLLESFKNFLSKYPYYNLVLSGRIEIKNFFKMIKKLDLYNKIILTGRVTEEEKVVLMRNASSFVYVSSYEGFGLPILEAQSLGVPVLTSNITALPEIGGNGALYVDPYNIQEIVDGLEKITFDNKLRSYLIEKGYENIKRFSFRNTANITLKIIEDVYKFFNKD